MTTKEQPMKNKKSIPPEEHVSTARKLARRDFLKVSGSGLFILFAPGTFSQMAFAQPGRGYPTDLNAYLKIGADGRVSLFCSKIEMGQGIFTSMAQMLAEELDVELDSDQALRLEEVSRVDLGFPHNFLSDPNILDIVSGGSWEQVLNHRPGTI